MSPDLFLATWLLVLTGRRWAERGGPGRVWAVRIVWLLPVLLVATPAGMALLLMTLAVAEAVHRLLRRTPRRTLPTGGLSLGATSVLLLVVMGLPQLAPRPEAGLWWRTWVEGNALLHGAPPDAGHLLLLWATLVWVAAVEGNHITTWVLGRVMLLPPPHATAAEPSRGRVIGMLERGIVALLALHGHVEGLGLLLAAKGFARFRDMDDRPFAEYVLIGTLASVGTALLAGLLFRIWL